ncbi:MAG: hypothetical protein HRT94_03350 [Alphaproteobacteria bacterium]|nr:hypothetical protein [Alphaproteobacteria bacterium]
MGIQPIMVFPGAPKSGNPHAYSDEMSEFTFYDRELMNDIIIPYMDAQSSPILTKDGKPKKKICYSPKQLCQIYKDAGVKAFVVDDVNSEAHIEYVKETEGLIGGICDRGLQIFQQPVIDAFRSKRFEISGDSQKQGEGFLWNLHPGRLPDHRGLLPVFRAAAEGVPTFDVTLHEIVDPTIDTGAVLGATPITFDPDKSLLAHYSDPTHINAGTGHVMKALGDVLESGKPRSRMVQDRRKGSLYSYPSPEEVRDFKMDGGVWIDQPKKEWDPLANAFANNSEHRSGLRAAIEEAVNRRYGRPASNTVGGISAPQSSTRTQPPKQYDGMRMIT